MTTILHEVEKRSPPVKGSSGQTDAVLTSSPDNHVRRVVKEVNHILASVGIAYKYLDKMMKMFDHTFGPN